jgi:hypothetical protein
LEDWSLSSSGRERLQVERIVEYLRETLTRHQFEAFAERLAEGRELRHVDTPIVRRTR